MGDKGTDDKSDTTSRSEFDVPTSDTRVAKRSHLGEELQNSFQNVDNHEKVPCLFDDSVCMFHDVEGRTLFPGGTDVVKLVHTVQGHGSPPDNPVAESIEVHAPNTVYTLTADDLYYYDESYPDDEYSILVELEDYMISDYSFHDELLDESVDKRETEFEFNITDNA